MRAWSKRFVAGAAVAAAAIAVAPSAASASPGPLSLSRTSAPNTGLVAVTICAAGLDGGAQVTLERAIEGAPIAATESGFVANDLFGCGDLFKNSLTATFDLTAQAPGEWTFVVRNSDGSPPAQAQFAVTGAAPTYAAGPITPNTAFVGTSADITIHGTNFFRGVTIGFSDGDADAANDIALTSRTWVDTQTVTARIHVPVSAPLGLQDLVVTNADGQARTCPDCLLVDDPNRRFVEAVYAQLLGRAPDPGGTAYWLAELGAGRPRTDTAGALLASDEFRGRIVQELFRSILGRSTDAGGLAHWIGVLRDGALYANIQGALLGSQEFLDKVGGSRSRFLDAAYVFAIGRLPDPQGRTYWNQQMDRGLSRADVALVLATSPEARARLVDAYYRTFLRRPADSGGITYWALSMAINGVREEVVIAALVGSDEFKALNG